MVFLESLCVGRPTLGSGQDIGRQRNGVCAEDAGGGLGDEIWELHITRCETRPDDAKRAHRAPPPMEVAVRDVPQCVFFGRPRRRGAGRVGSPPPALAHASTASGS